MPQTVTAQELVDRYDVLLLDAFGVLNNGAGPLPIGLALLDEIRRQNKRYLVLTNDVSRLPETISRRLRGFGMDIPDHAILTSGFLIKPYFDHHNLAGSRCIVLGTDDTRAYVRHAGGIVVAISEAAEPDVVIAGDDAGFDFLPGMDATVSAMFRALDDGRSLHLLLPNPDVVYPKGERSFGFTAGGVALLLETAIAQRYPHNPPRFVRLGKPHRPIFAEALRRAGGDRVVMVGDQIATDIAGAVAAGIAAALVPDGVSRLEGAEVLPNYIVVS